MSRNLDGMHKCQSNEMLKEITPHLYHYKEIIFKKYIKKRLYPGNAIMLAENVDNLHFKLLTANNVSEKKIQLSVNSQIVSLKSSVRLRQHK